eukprot:6436821-Pyramimonas_sp.AAC.1
MNVTRSSKVVNWTPPSRFNEGLRWFTSVKKKKVPLVATATTTVQSSVYYIDERTCRVGCVRHR